MSVEQAVIAILLGVVASLASAGILWAFRRQVRDTLTALDMSAGAALGWLMAFVMLAVIIVFPLIGKDIPGSIVGLFGFLVGALIFSLVLQRK